MDHPQLSTVRRQLGELGVMSEQTQRAERQILERAQARLEEVEKAIASDRQPALAGDGEASQRYQGAIAERGQLQIVIAQARKMLGE